MNIVFFGTPAFAVPSLRALLGEGFNVVGVVTQPDRARKRSRSTLVPPPVKDVAEAEGLPVFQPERPSDPEFLNTFAALAPDLGVVVAYGHILKPALLRIPTRGMINVHASLLPAFRGAAPIEHALMDGADETGISIMQLDEGMDSGPVFLRVPTRILPDETGGELTVRLAELGALALIEALALMDVDAIRAEPQDHDRATYAPKLTTDMARIRWEEPADRIARQVRALDPRPGAWTETADGTRLKLFGPRPGPLRPDDAEPGDIVSLSPAFAVAAGDGTLEFVDVQPAGRGRMATTEWARGRAVAVGDRLR